MNKKRHLKELLVISSCSLNKYESGKTGALQFHETLELPENVTECQHVLPMLLHVHDSLHGLSAKSYMFADIHRRTHTLMFIENIWSGHTQAYIYVYIYIETV